LNVFTTFVAILLYIIAPSVLYLTNIVAGSPHVTQNLEFFSALDVKGSILFSVFPNIHLFTDYA